MALRSRLLPGVPFDWKWRLGTPTLRSGTGVVNESYQRLVSSLLDPSGWFRIGTWEFSTAESPLRRGSS
jgi:hypothetical protein